MPDQPGTPGLNRDGATPPARVPAPGGTRSVARKSAGIESGSFRLFRVAGIDVRMHWSWFLVAYYQIQHRGSDYSSPAWKVVEYLTLFGIVLLHEFGHTLACRQVGGIANLIVLWPLGGVAYVRPPHRPGATLWSLAAGPLVNVVLVPITVGVWFAGARLGWAHASPDLRQYLFMIVLTNLVLLIFNMLPIYPLDGGQIVRSLLWFVVGPARSLMAVTVIGLVVGTAAVGWSLYLANWWFVAMSVFVLWRSVIGFQMSRQLVRILEAPRRLGAACPSCGASPPVGPFWGCPQCRTQFDIFESRSGCPACGVQFATAQCLDCAQSSPMAAWIPAWGTFSVIATPPPAPPDSTYS